MAREPGSLAGCLQTDGGRRNLQARVMEMSPMDLASSRVVVTTAALGVLAAGIAFLLYRFEGKAHAY